MSIPLFKVNMAPSVDAAVKEVLHSGYITQGPKVEEFEFKLKQWLDIPRILSLNAGTNALQLAVYLAGIQPGDKIISTPMTCSATNTAIMAMGGKIIWADINPLTGNIDPDSIRARFKDHPEISSVMMVHWGGYPCDIDEINDIAQEYGANVIEDAAHAFGATYKDLKIGNHSDFVCFSFQAIKHLTTIDGGALVCKDQYSHERGKLLRWFGIDREQPRKDFRCEADVEEAGWKYHMNDVNATVGIENLRNIDDIVNRHITNGLYYDIQLRQIPGITLLKRSLDRISSYWIYTLLVKDREHFTKEMTKRGITVSQVHARNDRHTMCREFDGYSKYLKGVDEFTEHQINIPVGWWLTVEDREYIVNAIREVKGI